MSEGVNYKTPPVPIHVYIRRKSNFNPAKTTANTLTKNMLSQGNLEMCKRR